MGKGGSDAYREVYGASPNAANANAARLLANDSVRRRVGELKEASATATVLSLREKREYLASLVRGAGEEARLADRLRALELDAKLAGEFTEKFQHSGQVEHRHFLDEVTRRKIMELRARSMATAAP